MEEKGKGGGKGSVKARRHDLVNVVSLIVVAQQGFSRRQRFAKPPTSTENAPLIYAMSVECQWSGVALELVLCLPGRASEFGKLGGARARGERMCGYPHFNFCRGKALLKQL